MDEIQPPSHSNPPSTPPQTSMTIITTSGITTPAIA